MKNTKAPKHQEADGVCRHCGCTAQDCSQCVERTGDSCFWITPQVCSACVGDEALAVLKFVLGQDKKALVAAVPRGMEFLDSLSAAEKDGHKFGYAAFGAQMGPLIEHTRPETKKTAGPRILPGKLNQRSKRN
jgi:hypothetical protein